MSVTYSIVDDDPVAISVLKKMCEQFSDFEFDQSYDSGLAFIQDRGGASDLLFLDVEMPDVSGLDVLNSMSNPPMVVLFTGYPNYAFEAFEHDVVDFLLKPIEKPRFLKMVKKVQWENERRNSNPHERSEKEQKSLFIKKKGVFKKVVYNQILFAKSESEYIKIVTRDDHFLHYGALKDLVKTLPDQFMRVHRSYIVNLNHISTFGLNSLEIGDELIPVSNTYAEKLKEHISTLT